MEDAVLRSRLDGHVRHRYPTRDGEFVDGRAVIFDRAIGRAVDAELADGPQHDVLGVDHRTGLAAIHELDRRGDFQPDLSEHERRGDVGRAHAGRERAEGAVGARVRIAADDELAGSDQALFGKHDVLDAAAADVEEVLDVLLGRKIFHQLRQLGRLRVLRRNEVIGDERDLPRIEDALRALHAAHHADGDGGGELVRENEVDLSIDDLARLDARQVRVACEDLLG